ncbi:hypothetical protein P43SY_004587 [Pythium insidiosum]|uniref:Transmembrane protein 198 n=1 Tax=Pythium insidiosum TaxID=114742 RepID=A0AAD5Q7M8_PYTIN|nr:hypothetical protein P43SY_004587 [Pythium insidiosum]
MSSAKRHAARSIRSAPSRPPPPPPSPPPPAAAAHPSTGASTRVMPLAIQRGAFSEHMLPLEVASPRRPPSPSGRSAIGPSSVSLLRSPSKMRAPEPTPPPTAPQPSLLRSPVSPSKRVDAKENIAVNAVDALAKKLRQQAAELSDVYEAMEKKEKDVDRLGQQLRDVRQQLERQKTEQQQRPLAVSSRVAAARQTRDSRGPTAAAAKRIHSTASSSKRRPAATADPDASSDGLERIQASLQELREVHAELNRRLAKSAVGQEGPEPAADHTALQRQEQQLYIRVLEEAVHLKARELQITGHEELLVVLAELRHTIYEQERELSDARDRIERLTGQCTTVQAAHADLEQQRQAEDAKYEKETTELRARAEALERQLHETQRLVHHEVMRLRQAQSTQSSQQERIRQLEAESRRHADKLKESERRCERVTGEMEALRSSLQAAQRDAERERDRADSTQIDLNKATNQVEELKALQESLLASIDKLVVTEDASQQRITALEAQLEQAATLKADREQLDQEVTALREQLARSQSAQEELRVQVTEWGKWEKLFHDVAAVVETLKDRTDVADELRPIQSTIQDAAGPSWLLSLVNMCANIAQELQVASSSWDVERSDLRVTCQELERSTDLTMTELRRVQTQLLETQERLAMSEGEREHLQLEHLALTEELHAVHAQRGLEAALAEQLQQLQQIVELQKRRLHDVLQQNDELTTLETNLVVALDAKDSQIAHLEARISEHTNQLRQIQVLEDELEDAAALSEEQQTWNQQLTVELETLELERAENDQLVEALRARDHAVSSRVSALFSQYLQAVNARQLSSVAKTSVNQLAHTPSVHEKAMISGDVLQMLRVFPTLVDSIFVAGAAGGVLLAFTLHNTVSYKIYPEHPTYVLVALAIALGIICGVLALKLEKPVLVVATSFVGAVATVWGIGYFAGEFPNAADLEFYRSKAANGDWEFSIPDAWWGYLAGIIVLFAFGMMMQFRKTGRDGNYHSVGRKQQTNASAAVPAYNNLDTPPVQGGNPRYGNPVSHV